MNATEDANAVSDRIGVEKRVVARFSERKNGSSIITDTWQTLVGLRPYGRGPPVPCPTNRVRIEARALRIEARALFFDAASAARDRIHDLEESY